MKALWDRRSALRLLAAGGAASRTLFASPRQKQSRPQQAPDPRIDPEGPLRIGMIGRTGHTGLVLGELENVAGARITAYAFEDGSWDRNSDGTRRGRSYDLDRQRRWVEGQSWASSRPRLYETYQEMLDKEEIDLAVVCLPYARNAPAIAEAARSGAHVLSEKPVAVNPTDLEMIEEAVAETGIRLSAMFSMRFSPPIFTIRQCVGRGVVGAPILGRAQKSYKWGESRPWFYSSPEIYGSTILWVGIHAIDYLRWAMGLEVLKVSGFHTNRAHPESPAAQDSAVLSLLMEGGVPAAVTMDYLRPESAPSHGDDRLRIAGSTGVIEKGSHREQVELIAGGSQPGMLPLEAPGQSLFADFVSELRGQGRHLIGPHEAVRVTRICIAATKAAEEARTVTIGS